MIEFAWPAALLAVVLPWIVRRVLAPVVRDDGLALRLPFYAEAVAVGESSMGGGARSWLLVAALLWALLCIAAARPQRIGEETTLPRSGRDLLLAIDVSGSMASEDMEIGGQAVNRLVAVQAVVGDFLTRRVGDRVGLILFGAQAYLLTPLTFDRESVRFQLETSAVGLAGRETAIGDAIGLAVKRLRGRPPSQRVLILLTDGVNTAGVIEPMRAAALAREAEVRVYTVGVGGDGGGMHGLLGFNFAMQGAEIDEATLRRVASETGGRYFRARDTRELSQIYAELERIEPAAQEGKVVREIDELYIYPLSLALALTMLIALRRSGAEGN